MKLRKMSVVVLTVTILTIVLSISVLAGSYSSGLGGGTASGYVSTTEGYAKSYYAPGSMLTSRNVSAYVKFLDGDGNSHTSEVKTQNTYDHLVEAKVSFSGYSKVYYLRGTHKINNSTGSWAIAP